MSQKNKILTKKKNSLFFFLQRVYVLIIYIYIYIYDARVLCRRRVQHVCVYGWGGGVPEGGEGRWVVITFDINFFFFLSNI